MTNTTFNASQSNGLGSTLARPMIDLAAHLVARLSIRMERARTRRALEQLSAEQLDDIGIDRSVVGTVSMIPSDPRLESSLMSLR